jgi:predicted nucleotidyltransferase
MKHLPSELLDEIVQRLVQGLKPEKVILFGSHAYGEPTEDSDIDLLVIVSESNEPRHHRARTAYDALWGMTAPTEVLVLTRQEVERSSTVIASLVHQAIHKGRVLYG